MVRRSTPCSSPMRSLTLRTRAPRTSRPLGLGGRWRTPAEPLSVYGDSAYGAGSVLNTLERGEAEIMCKVQPPNVPAGRWAKDAFQIDLNSGTVTCPIGQAVPLRAIKDGHIAKFRHAGRSCTKGEVTRVRRSRSRAVRGGRRWRSESPWLGRRLGGRGGRALPVPRLRSRPARTPTQRFAVSSRVANAWTWPSRLARSSM